MALKYLIVANILGGGGGTQSYREITDIEMKGEIPCGIGNNVPSSEENTKLITVTV